MKAYKDKTKRWKLYAGDCVSIAIKLKENSVDSLVCDPPYCLESINKRFSSKTAAPAKHGKDGAFSRKSKGFLGQAWDSDVAFQVKTWLPMLKVIKPGGYLIAFGGTRTYHRMVMAIERAGFIIRDQLAWMYGTGMTHGQNIEKMALKNGIKHSEKYKGLNTTLCPGWEPIVLAQKPISEKTILKNVLKWGVGCLAIDVCRLPITATDDKRLGGKGSWATDKAGKTHMPGLKGVRVSSSSLGRWPKNILHDSSPEVMAEFAKYGNKTSGEPGIRNKEHKTVSMAGKLNITGKIEAGYADTGSIARYFYSAKSSKLDKIFSTHPTIKPNALMRYLCRLVTPFKNQVVLDPFCGSGSTLLAANQEGFKAIGIELEQKYVKDIRQRMRLYRQGHLKDIKTFKAYQATLAAKEPVNATPIRDNAKQPKPVSTAVAAKSKKSASAALRPKTVKKSHSAKKAKKR